MKVLEVLAFVPDELAPTKTGIPTPSVHRDNINFDPLFFITYYLSGIQFLIDTEAIFSIYSSSQIDPQNVAAFSSADPILPTIGGDTLTVLEAFFAAID